MPAHATHATHATQAAWLRVGKAAELLEVSEETVRRMIARDELTARRLHSRSHYQVLAADVEALRSRIAA